VGDQDLVAAGHRGVGGLKLAEREGSGTSVIHVWAEYGSLAERPTRTSAAFRAHTDVGQLRGVAT